MERVYHRESIQAELTTSRLGKELHFFEQIGSTNEEARKEALNSAPDGALFVADMQTAGKGRRGRTWNSPAGANIYFSLLLKPQLPTEKASMLTLVAAHAICRGLRAVTGLSCGIKWPNDLVAEGKKVCGILTELHMLPEAKVQTGQGPEVNYAVVIGAGINVRKQDFGALSETAISLEECLERSEKADTEAGAEAMREKPETCLDRNKILAGILQYLEEDLDLFVKRQGFADLKESYSHMLVNRDRSVRVLDPKGEYEGVTREINEEGELLVELQNGEWTAVYAGEVSVRGIYGYV